jgi:hypothetical protein
MQVITDFDRRVGNVYEIANKVTQNWACSYYELGKWGITSNGKQMLMLQDMGVLYMFLAMLEWKAMEQNTYNLTYDENNCPEWKYPGNFVDEKFVDCLVKHFHCQGIDIRTILRKFGVLPLEGKPDGIDYMHIESGNPPCDNKLFQINKPYGTDFV